MDDLLTPADLSRELGVDQRAIRAYLREHYGKLTPPETRWRLSEELAANVRAGLRVQA